MGLGTKIKEAMHGDKETTSQQSPTTSTSHTNKTPGAFPAEDVPRTSTVPVGSAGEPRTEKMHGKNSPDYTHGSGKDSSLTGAGHTGTTGTTGSHGGLTGSERRHEGGLSQHGTSGMTGSNTTGVPHTGTTGTSHTNTTGTHGHNKLTKDAPYDEYGSSTTGTHGRSHNDGLTSGHQGTHGTHGTTGMTGTSGAPEGTHGTHNSRVANAADPRIDSDRDHRAAPGSYAAPGMSSPNHGTTGMTGANTTGMTGSHSNTGMTDLKQGPADLQSGTHTGTHTGNHNGTPGMMTGATGTHDSRKVHYDDRINPRSPTTPGSGLTDSHHNTTGGVPGSNHGNGMTGSNHGTTGMTGSHHGTTGGMTGGSNNTMRDHKVNEYDAPTNSSGRGHAGVAGAAAGAAGGAAASGLANRHHNDDMQAYNTPGAGASSTDRGLNTADRWHNSDPTMSGGNNMNTTTSGVHSGSPSLMGTTHMNPTGATHGTTHGHTGSMGNNNTSMLDPHNETNRTTYGTDNSPSGTGIGAHHSHHGHRAESNGMATGTSPHMAGGGLASNEYAAGAPHQQQQHQSGMAGGIPHGGVSSHDNTRGGIPHESGMTNQHMGNVSPTGNTTSSHHMSGSGNSPSHNTSGSGSGMGMGAMANSLPGMGDGHHGPGHASAKVLHRCDHCGNDNDISRYFSKEAAYRMS
ncbi:hypothetical protein PG996_013781 [Apiospora saccharicola]|uniref:Uncharacterized protein n=1 Tax=Apiospora saccharicola TaxID=335842 RepID=A0ABR1TGJ0_9PEZI